MKHHNIRIELLMRYSPFVYYYSCVCVCSRTIIKNRFDFESGTNNFYILIGFFVSI